MSSAQVALNDDEPLSVTLEKIKKNLTKDKMVKKKTSINGAIKKPIKKESSQAPSSGILSPVAEATPPNRKRKREEKAIKGGTKVKKVSKISKKSSDNEDELLKKKKLVLEKSKIEPEEEQYKWWEEDNDDSIKWKTFEHNGVLLPPDYSPHGIKMLYDGRPISLSPDSEEVATFFAAVLGTDHAENPIFRDNFFRDFKGVLDEFDKEAGKIIQSLEKCDFSPIASHLEKEKEARKALTKEEKKAIKEQKLKDEEKYAYAIIDGRKEKVGNFRIEPPGLFRGRGAHPKAGCLKKRVLPEQITLNLGEDAKVPEPPKGHSWGRIVHDNTVTWLATWKENVNESFKYVFLAAGSCWKGQSDFKKFEKAKELKKHVHKIRKEYLADLKDITMLTRQRATALYLIDRFALRAGNEKGDDEADTVGCCSLRVEHVTLVPPSTVIFDFLGKDSIRYYNEVQVDKQVFKNLRLFQKSPKTKSDLLFDRISTVALNKHLNSLMAGLSAKVFRTYNASYTFQQELKNTPADGTIPEKLLAYNRANRQVAVLCNHQRTVSKGHGSQMMRLQDKVKAVKYDLRRAREMILEADKSMVKQMPELKDEESDLDDEWIESYEKQLQEREEQKQQAKLEKENEKRKEQGLKPLDELPKVVKREPAMEKMVKKFEALKERVVAIKSQLIDKDENKTTALSTSKINYIDPRISVVWCYKHGVPLDKIFNKSLRVKFQWAFDLEPDWVNPFNSSKC